MSAALEELAALGLFVERGFLEAALRSEILAAVSTRPGQPATVSRDYGHLVDEKVRRTKLVEFPDGARTAVKALLEAALPRLERHFGLELEAFQEPQLLRYRKGDYFRIHQDAVESAPENVRRRKISCVLFVNGPTRRPAAGSYCGGILTFYRLSQRPTWENCRTRLAGEEGLFVAFRSNVFHEVTAVLAGERYSIATWFY